MTTHFASRLRAILTRAFCVVFALALPAGAETVSKIWERRVPGIATYNPAQAVAADANGDIYVGGTKWTSDGPNDLYLAKYAAATGAGLWEKQYDGPGHGSDAVSAMVIDAEGNVIVTGASSGLNTGYDYYTAKYTSSGALVWEARYATPGFSTNNDFPADVAVDQAGNVIVTGQM